MPFRQTVTLWAVLLAAGLCAATTVSGAPAAPMLVVNGRPINDAATPPVMASGQVVWAARAFFREIGGEVAYQGDYLLVTRKEHRLRLQAGQRGYLLDGVAGALGTAPFMRGDSLYVPLQDLTRALGGSYTWDARANRATIVIDSSGKWAGPGRLQIISPRDRATVVETLYLQGTASPQRDLRMSVLRPAEGLVLGWVSIEEHRQMLRSDAEGRFCAKLPLAGKGPRRLLVTLLNEAGGVDAEKELRFELKSSGEAEPGPSNCPPGTYRLEIVSPEAGAEMTTGVLEAIGWANPGQQVEVEMLQGIQRLVKLRVTANAAGKWLARRDITCCNAPHRGSYQIIARTYDAEGKKQAQAEVRVTVTLPGPETR